jgi:hypothetical protein
VDLLTRIKKDQQALLAKGPRALAAPFSMLTGLDPKTIRRKGYVPENLRALYILQSAYEIKLTKAKAEKNQIELAALKAAVEYLWEKRFEECCRKIRKPAGASIRILGDWSIVVIDIKL